MASERDKEFTTIAIRRATKKMLDDLIEEISEELGGIELSYESLIKILVKFYKDAKGKGGAPAIAEATPTA